jgi:hypothetical protein
VKPADVVELAALLEEPGVSNAALEHRLAELAHAPPLAELLELRARARRTRATGEEIALALGALVACHAPRTGAFEH